MSNAVKQKKYHDKKERKSLEEESSFAYTGRHWIDTYVIGEPHPYLPEEYPIVKSIPAKWKQVVDWATYFMEWQFVKVQTEWIRNFHSAEHVLLNAPRGHGKTHIATLILPIYYVCEEPDIAVLVLSASKDLSGDYSDAIRKTFEMNDKIRAFYGCFDKGVTESGEVVRASKWSTHSWTVHHRTLARKEPTLQVAGVGSSIIGKHPDLIISDDLIQMEETWSDAKAKKREKWFKTVVKPMAMPEIGTREATKIWVLGTRKARDDIYKKIQEMEIFYCKTYKAILKRPKHFEYKYKKMPDGQDMLIGIKNIRGASKILAPEIWGIEKLLVEEKAIGKKIFSSEYQNEPVPDVGEVFDWDDVQLWHQLPVPITQIIKYQWLDSALSEKGRKTGRGSYSVIMTLGVHDNKFYILDIQRGRWGFNRNIDEMRNAYDKYKNVVYTGTESVMFQSMLAQRLKDETLLPLVTRGQEHLRHMNKDTRIRQLDVHFENKRIFINKDLKEFENFKYELLAYPEYQSNDILDALEGAIWLFQHKKPSRPDFILLG